MIYTYGIIDSNGRIDVGIEGLKGARVYNITHLDIGAASSEIKGNIPDITKSHVLKHDEVVEKLMSIFTVLPVRFLTTFKKKEDVIRMLGDNYGDFKENFTKLRNKVEFGIKIIWQGDKVKKRITGTLGKRDHKIPISGNSPGKRYMREKFKEHMASRQLEEEANNYIGIINGFLSRFAAEKKLEKMKSKNLLLNAYYLVRKERQRDFKNAFEKLKKQHDNFKYLLSGPWAPYNFIALTQKQANGNSVRTEKGEPRTTALQP